MPYKPVLNLPDAVNLAKGCCKGCPFNDGLNDEATQIQNYGCLPDKFDIVNNFKEHNQIWACHSKPEHVCTGLANYCKSHSLAVPEIPTAGERFGKWSNRNE